MAIKKAELHAHLEGTITPALARKLAQRNNITLPEAIFAQDGESYCYQDFLDFLQKYDIVAGVIKKPQDYYDITFDYLKSSAADDVIYVEMMYSPDHAEKSSNIPSGEHLRAIQQAIDDAKAAYNIIGRIIITAVRHFGEEAAIRVAKQAVKEKFDCIVGFGLGGDEINFPPKLFTQAYAIAAAGGLHCTIHAGEFAPASGMLEAIECLPIKRIGHGVQAIHSSACISKLIEQNIALEVCPGSNMALGLFANIQEHPLPRLVAAGVKVSLGSDDPPFFRTNIAKEYACAQNIWHYSNEEMQNFTLMAIESAFADAKTKVLLKQRLEQPVLL